MRKLEFQSTQYTMSAEQETLLGNQFADEIEKEEPTFDDPAIQAWLDRVGQALVQHSPPCPQTFTFKVAASEEVNAFAIPGGHCYVNVGLIRMAENEAEVVAVIGHEINHVTMRHGVRSMQRSVGAQALADLLAGGNEGMGQVVTAVKNAGGVLAMRGFSREDEREADEKGVEAMYKAGYDPRAAAAFFQKLHDLEQANAAGSSLMDRLLSSHPATMERIDNIKKQISTYNLRSSLILNSPEFQKVKQRLPKPKG
jgi:predicted Zn-dependent protease